MHPFGKIPSRHGIFCIFSFTIYEFNRNMRILINDTTTYDLFSKQTNKQLVSINSLSKNGDAKHQIPFPNQLESQNVEIDLNSNCCELIAISVAIAFAVTTKLEISQSKCCDDRQIASKWRKRRKVICIKSNAESLRVLKSKRKMWMRKDRTTLNCINRKLICSTLFRKASF